MNTQSTFEFQWLSPLGISVALFLFCGAIYFLMAVVGAVISHRYGVTGMPGIEGQFIFSAKADEIWFGWPPAEVVTENPRVGQLLLVFLDFMMGFMLAIGIVMMGIAWFGLRQGQIWALWITVAGYAGFLAYYWLLAVVPFMREFGFRYMEIWHPFALIPTVLVPIAAVLAWIGLRGS